MEDKEYENLIRSLNKESENNIRDEKYCKKQTERFTRMNLEDLQKIKPLWATGELLGDNICNRPDDQSNFIHINVYTNALIEAVHFEGLDPKILFSNESASNMSFVTTLDRWENCQPVDPPTLSFNKEKGYCELTDGRHRAILAYHLGEVCIPVAINNNSKQFIIGRVRICHN